MLLLAPRRPRPGHRVTVAAAEIREFASALQPRQRGGGPRPAQVARRADRVRRAVQRRDDPRRGFPKEERAALVAAEPGKFRMPRPSDLRYQWIEVRLAAIDVDEMRELVLDGWRLCVPRKISALIDGPADVGGASVVDVPVERVPDLQSDEHGAEAAMARATPQSLTNAERGLLASTERAELQRLGEDELADLLVRVRRARDEAVGTHRREVAAQVGEHTARGVASLPAAAQRIQGRAVRGRPGAHQHGARRQRPDAAPRSCAPSVSPPAVASPPPPHRRPTAAALRTRRTPAVGAPRHAPARPQPRRRWPPGAASGQPRRQALSRRAGACDAAAMLTTGDRFSSPTPAACRGRVRWPSSTAVAAGASPSIPTSAGGGRDGRR